MFVRLKAAWAVLSGRTVIFNANLCVAEPVHLPGKSVVAGTSIRIPS